MNFVFLSANYPEHYWMFCRGLKKQGARVLAIIDTPYETLNQDLKDNIDDHYYVSSFYDQDQLIKACGYFTYKYGKIDWIESNNEAWLYQDAFLREQFHVTTGLMPDELAKLQSKSAMKDIYKKANIPFSAYQVVTTFEKAKEFVKEVGFPVVLKPDHGVGAGLTYLVHDQKELQMLIYKHKEHCMILEEYIDGDVFTLDGLANKNSDILYLSSMKYISSIMESVQYQTSIGAFTELSISEEKREIAQRAIKAFNIQNRFFHMEFFEVKTTTKRHKKGDILGLEINIRAPGGCCPDLMNYASDIDVYELWAQVLLHQKADYSKLVKFTAGFAGRRNSIPYKYSIEEIKTMFPEEILEVMYLPDSFAQAMGNVVIIARFQNEKRRQLFYQEALAIVKEE